MESHILAPLGPRMQAAGLQCLELQIAAASPGPQARAFPGTELARKIRSHKTVSEWYQCHVVIHTTPSAPYEKSKSLDLLKTDYCESICQGRFH